MFLIVQFLKVSLEILKKVKTDRTCRHHVATLLCYYFCTIIHYSLLSLYKFIICGSSCDRTCECRMRWRKVVTSGITSSVVDAQAHSKYFVLIIIILLLKKACSEANSLSVVLLCLACWANLRNFGTSNFEAFIIISIESCFFLDYLCCLSTLLCGCWCVIKYGVSSVVNALNGCYVLILFRCIASAIVAAVCDNTFWAFLDMSEFISNF